MVCSRVNFRFWAMTNLGLMFVLVSLCSAGTWQDDFRDKNAKAWTPQKPPWVQSHGWTVKKGVYVVQVTGDDQSYSVTGETAWDDYSIEAMARYPRKGETPLHFGVGVRYQNFDAFHYYSFGFLHWPIGSPVRLFAFGGGVRRFFEAGTVGFEIEPDTWYTLKMEVKGKRFKCFLNGKWVGGFAHDVVKSGKAVLWGGPGDFEFDNVIISGRKIPNRVLAVQPQEKLATTWGRKKSHKGDVR